MLVERHSTVTSDDIYEFVTNKPPSSMNSKATSILSTKSERIPYDTGKADHAVIMKVLQFVCGRQHPPADAPISYMEDSLAGSMAGFQGQMTDEIKAGCMDMQNPISATFWELEMMHPSSEDLTLKVYEIVALVVDKSGFPACMVDMNIYILGDRSSGFTLDGVSEISAEKVDAEHIETAKVVANDW